MEPPSGDGGDPFGRSVIVSPCMLQWSRRRVTAETVQHDVDR